MAHAGPIIGMPFSWEGTAFFVEAVAIGLFGSIVGTILALLPADWLQVHGWDLGYLFANSSLMLNNVIRAEITPVAFVIGFIPGLLANVVGAAIAELEYHDRLLTALGLDESHKTVLHVGGGGAAEPDAADDRFAAGFERLSEGARRRLVLENDERRPLSGVLALAGRLGVPVVLDVFHHRLAPSLAPLGVRGLVLLAGETWSPRDGRQEVHFSTQEPGRRPGAHASTIDLEAFARFAEEAGDLPLDCILEVKDKERSVLRARESLRRRGPDAGVPVSPPRSRRSRERAPRGQRRRTA